MFWHDRHKKISKTGWGIYLCIVWALRAWQRLYQPLPKVFCVQTRWRISRRSGSAVWRVDASDASIFSTGWMEADSAMRTVRWTQT
jgi:hypothetical protein